MSGVNLILEGLNQLRINEASNYNSKLGSFLGDESKETQTFVKKALNDLFLGLKKDGDGYIEGKRPTIKDHGNYKTMLMRIQTKKEITDDKGGTAYGRDIASKYWKSYGKYLSEERIDGANYNCVFQSLEGDFEKSFGEIWTQTRQYAEFKDKTSLEKNVVIGINVVGYPHSYSNKYWYHDRPEDEYGGKYIDKSYRGNTYDVIISIPKIDNVEYDNKYATKGTDSVVFSNGKGFSVTYSLRDGDFHIVKRDMNDDTGIASADSFNIIYKKGRNSYKAYQELMIKFNSTTTVGDVEEILKSYKIPLSTSYWFNPYTD